LHALTSQIVGSYTKPHWLVHPQLVRGVEGKFWRPEPAVLAEAQDDAALLAIYEQERAGMDLVTDGEARRGSYDRHFLTQPVGIDSSRLERVGVGGPIRGDERAAAGTRTGRNIPPSPRWARRSSGRSAGNAPRRRRKHASPANMRAGPVKAVVIGPLTLSRSLADHHYGSEEALVAGAGRGAEP